MRTARSRKSSRGPGSRSSRVGRACARGPTDPAPVSMTSPSPSWSSRTQSADPAGQVGPVRVEMTMVESQGDAHVAEIGDHCERVLEPVIGEPVGAIPVAQAHVGDIHLARRRPSGAAAATARAAAGRPERAISAPCRAGRLVIPAPTAARMSLALGSDRAQLRSPVSGRVPAGQPAGQEPAPRGGRPVRPRHGRGRDGRDHGDARELGRSSGPPATSRRDKAVTM